MQKTLSSLETALYFSIWITANYYALYKLFKEQNSIFKSYDKLQAPGLESGWPILARYRDTSDIEWSSWKYFLSKSWHYLIVQFIVSEMLRHTKQSLLPYWYIASSMTFVLTNFGLKHFGIVMLQPIIFGIVVFMKRTKLSVWLTVIMQLMIYNTIKYKELLWDFLDKDDLDDEEVYLLLFSIGWIELRCISYCLDYVERNPLKNMKDTKYKNFCKDALYLLSYVLYLPWLYMGPLILYNEFESSLEIRQSLHARIKRFIQNIFIYLFYTFLLDLALHYIYFLALQEDIEFLKKLSKLALCGGGLWMGLEFHLKYVISYGTTGSFALLDNIRPPPTPRCVVRVHVYSEMWRYFDVGLYRFLIKYIYKPSSAIISQYITLSRTTYTLLASLVAFLFIFLWHGTTWAIFIWSLLNFVGIVCENLGRTVSETYYYKMLKDRVLISDAMEQRFVAFLCAPLLALSAISNFYLFSGYEIGNLYLECITQPALYSSIILLVSLYSCCHVSMILKDVPSRTAFYK